VKAHRNRIIRQAPPIGQAERDAHREVQARKQAYGAWVGRMGWMYFVTLTYDRPVRSYAAWALFQDYICRLEAELGTPVFYYAVPEPSPPDGTHIHLLIKAPGLMPNGHMWRGTTAGRMQPSTSIRGSRLKTLILNANWTPQTWTRMGRH
jgi:hypothetical protein